MLAVSLLILAMTWVPDNDARKEQSHSQSAQNR